jgi:hypothetical protein
MAGDVSSSSDSWWVAFTRPATLVTLFAATASLALSRHEMWMDELNPWVIGRDAHSLRELFADMRFEPHPPVWYLCLYALTRVTQNPAAMQVLHGAIATGSVAVIAYFSPFRRRDVWLLAFGYYFVFEYCAISRGYALGILFSAATCAVATAPRPRPILIAALLALLANTSAFGLILAGALAIAIAPLAIRGARDGVLGGLILAAGMGSSINWLLPSPENVFGRDRHLTWSLVRLDDVTRLFGTAYVPIPQLTSPSPWNSNGLVAATRTIPVVGHFVPLALSVGLFALVLIHLRRRPALLAAFVSGTAAMLGLMYVEYSGGYRHHGHFFVLLVLLLWLAGGRHPPIVAAPRWFFFVLVVQLAAGAYFVGLDFVRPFSASKALAQFFLADERHLPIVVAQPSLLNYEGPGLSSYLRRHIYYATAAGIERSSYLEYDAAHARTASEDEIVQEVDAFANGLGSDVYVVVSRWDVTRFGRKVFGLTQRTIEGDESLTAVYLFERSGRRSE